MQYHYGWGQHQQTLTTHQRIEALKYNSIGQTFGVLGSTFGRLSTIATMFTLFGINRKLRRGLWTLFAAQLITNGAVVVCLYAQCTNVVLLWDSSVSGTCWNADVQTVSEVNQWSNTIVSITDNRSILDMRTRLSMAVLTSS